MLIWHVLGGKQFSWLRASRVTEVKQHGSVEREGDDRLRTWLEKKHGPCQQVEVIWWSWEETL